jgi:hypothetical protein
MPATHVQMPFYTEEKVKKCDFLTNGQMYANEKSVTGREKQPLSNGASVIYEIQNSKIVFFPRFTINKNMAKNRILPIMDLAEWCTGRSADVGDRWFHSCSIKKLKVNIVFTSLKYTEKEGNLHVI